jgi:ubiquinone/menaquinone biosynthesis C-methylase UbiE
MYEGFANVYEHMMNHIPYEEWFEKIRVYLTEHGVSSGTVCELGCGTGIMTEKFAAAGYNMIGIDRSEDMLALAQEKKEESGSDILYLNQNMEEMELDAPVSAIISVCDTVNYILDEEGMLSLFSRVKQYLQPGGYFIFDLKTTYCYRNIIGNQTWAEQDEEVSYIWENYYYEDEDINEYMLTIFRKRPDSELYERIEEAHYQRAYPVDRLRELLEKSGLKMVECFDADMKSLPHANSERIYVVAQN